MSCDKILDNFDKVILMFLREAYLLVPPKMKFFQLFLHTIVFWPQTYVIDTSAVSVSMLKVSAIKSENS